MTNQSVMRKLKRDALHREGAKFSTRLKTALRTGKPVSGVRFDIENKQVVAKQGQL